MSPYRRRMILTLVLVTLAFHAAPTSAEPLRCRRAINKANANFVRATTKALAVCEAARAGDPSAPACPDATASRAFAAAERKLRDTIGAACGGVDKLCANNLTSEDMPGTLGWPTTCPNVLHGDCRNTIVTCEDIATCLACTGRVVAGQATGLVDDDVALPSTGKCRLGIAKATSAFVAARSKALAKCRDARLVGKHQDECVPPAVGDGKYLTAIAKADAKRTALVCKACGGADATCGGGDDATPAAIGAPAMCPAVTVPGGTACGLPIDDVASLDDCIGCLASFDTACPDRIALPGITSYPAECNACLAPPPSGSCPTTVEFTADGPAVDLDTGWRGLAHDASVPSNGRLTLAVTGCAGASQPSCGECSVQGPIPNAGGVAFENRRCADATWIGCTADGDCTNAGVLGPCSYFFGPPLPLVAGGVATCVVNRVNGPVSGTIDLDDGTSATALTLASNVFRSGTVTEPCPVCRQGKCRDGTRIMMSCEVQGSGALGDVSLDCPPSDNTFVGTLAIPLTLSTGAQSRTITPASPRCTTDASRFCACDTCNDLAHEACATNADCPPSGGNPGVCGGRRCLGGTNAGAPCSAASACPGGACDRPGEPTRANACTDDSTTPIDGSLCADVGGNEGICPEGPVDQVCSIETQRSCASNADCNPPPQAGSTCPDCRAGQTCTSRFRACFTDNGLVGATVQVSGAWDPPCDGVSYPTVGSLFCVGPVSSSAVNSAAGLPGLGRIRVPGTVAIADR